MTKFWSGHFRETTADYISSDSYYIRLMVLLETYITPHTISSKPFFVIGLSAFLLSHAYRFWRSRVNQEAQTSTPTAATKWIGRVVVGSLVAVGLFTIGVIGWMVGISTGLIRG